MHAHTHMCTHIHIYKTPLAFRHEGSMNNNKEKQFSLVYNCLNCLYYIVFSFIGTFVVMTAGIFFPLEILYLHVIFLVNGSNLKCKYFVKTNCACTFSLFFFFKLFLSLNCNLQADLAKLLYVE